MAEEDRHDEVPAETPPENVSAAALVLGASSREKADAFLEEQTRLAREQTEVARLQAEDLRREDRLRHWSLRVRHISDVMKLTFEFGAAAIALAILIGLGAMLWTAAHDKGLVIEAFSVPPEMAARGLTGRAVAAGLQGRLAALQAATDSARPADTYANNWGNDIKVQIPDTGVSIGAFYQSLASWLGHRTRISGEVWKSGDTVSITVRAGSNGSETVTGSASDFSALVQKAAEKIYAETQPYRYAAYLDDNGQHAAAQLLYRRLLNVPGERVWALNALALGLGRQGRGKPGRALFRAALALDPHFVLAEVNLAGNLQAFGRSEQAFLETRKAAADLQNKGGEITERARRLLLRIYEGRVDADLGDFAGAIAEGRAAERLPDYFHNVEGQKLFDLSLFGALHDEAAFEARLHTLPPPPNSAVAAFRLEYEAVGEAALGQWTKAKRDLAAAQATNASLGGGAVLAGDLRVSALEARIDAETGDVAAARKLIAGTPQDCVPCVLARARIEALAGDTTAATHWYEIAVHEAPSLPEPLFEWGEMLLHNGDYDGAIAKFTSAHAKGPNYADPLEGWGEALMAKNRPELAIAKFAEAARYAPHWGRLHLKWGEALAAVGKEDEAKNQYALAGKLFLTPKEQATLNSRLAKKLGN